MCEGASKQSPDLKNYTVPGPLGQCQPASSGEGNLRFFSNKGPQPFLKGNNSQILKLH